MLSNICSCIFQLSKKHCRSVSCCFALLMVNFAICTRNKFIIVANILMTISLWILSGLLPSPQSGTMSNFKAIGNIKRIYRGFNTLRDLVVRHRSNKWTKSCGLVQPKWPYPFPSLWTSYWKSGMSLWSRVYFWPLIIVRDSFIGPTGIAVIGPRLVVFGDVGYHGLHCTKTVVMYHPLLYMICPIAQFFYYRKPWTAISVALSKIRYRCCIKI